MDVIRIRIKSQLLNPQNIKKAPHLIDYRLKSTPFCNACQIPLSGRSYCLTQRGLEDQILTFASETTDVGRFGMNAQCKR
jgi:hypothetical protein